jgi:hypothetical protein
MKRIGIVIISITLLVSCKKEKKTVDENPVTPDATSGNLKGTVTQYNQFGVTYTTGLNTTTVSIDSINVSSVTDENGRYSFANISNGKYSLSFKKPGCGLIKMFDINFNFKDTTTYNAGIADIPTFSLLNGIVKDTAWFSTTLPGIYYTANSLPINNKATAVAIVGKNTNINLEDPLSYIKFSPASLINTLDYGRFLSYNFLSQSYGFKKDSVIYVKIYPVANTAASYYNNKIKKPVYTAHGSSLPIFTITMR